ncbi:MAG: DNA oxidative demethylase AlkB [Gammaproteobacteria bacterium]
MAPGRVTNGELFDAQGRVDLDEGVVLLRGRARADAAALLAAVETLLAVAPLRRMVTPGGLTMSVAMTNCGECGWVSDRKGYRYASVDPDSGRPWPALPAPFARLASAAAAEAGFADFAPDVCLVNEYLPGTKLTLHQDRDEASFAWPIVSVSLGASATFLLGGLRRRDRTQRLPLHHGDVLIWGGPARLRHHGVLPLKAEPHPLLGERRINLTLRRAL